MTLLAPGALWWLLIGVPVVALFFLRRRVVEVEIPALVFWEQMRRQDVFNRWGRRLRRWLNLLVQLLVVLALVLALCEPISPAQRAELLVVLDDSATMQTIEEDGRSRFDLAREIVRQYVRSRPDGTPATIILAGTPPMIAVTHETSAEQTAVTLASLKARDVNPRIPEAVALAQSKQRDTDAKILVISDRYQDGLAARDDIDWIQVGRDRPNVGVRAILPSEDASGVRVVLQQHLMSPATVTVSLLTGQQRRAGESIVLSDAVSIVELRAELNPGDPFRIEVEPADALMLDNTAYGVWPKSSRPRLRLVCDGNPFLEAALDQPKTLLEIVSPGNWTQSSEMDVTILDSPRGDPIGRVAGRYLVIGGVDPFGLTRKVPVRENLTPTQWAADNPVMRDVDLPQWRIERGGGLALPLGAKCLVRDGDVPLVFAVKDAGQKSKPEDDFAAVYLNFELADSNLPRRASFPVFVWNAIDYLLDRRVEDSRIAHTSGTELAFPPQPNSETMVYGPDNEALPAFFDEGRAILPFPERAGFYSLKTDQGTLVRAVNYVSDGFARKSADSELSAVRMHGSWPATWPLWALFAIAAGVVMLIDMLLFHSGFLRMD